MHSSGGLAQEPPRITRRVPVVGPDGSSVGRVLKYELRSDGVTTATWDREAAGVVFDRR